MPKIDTIRKTRWDGGMKSDIRDESFNGARLIKNLDPITNPFSPILYRNSESANDTPGDELNNFLETNNRVYALGVQTGTARTKIFFKPISEFSTFGDDATWDEPTNAESGAFTQFNELFVFYTYGGTDYIFGGQTNRIWKFAVDGSGFTDADLSVTFTNVSQGVVHSRFDNLYVPYDNKIAENDAGSWTAAKLTLPAEYLLRGLAEFGNYLAIPAKPLSTGSGKTNSRVYLWDMTSTEPNESIDFGAGDIEIVEELNGEVIGIMTNGNRLIVKRATSISAQTIIDFPFDDTITLTQRKQKKNDRIYFMMTAPLDGVTHYGVWAIGKNKLGEWCLYLDRTPDNDTDPTNIEGFIIVDSSGDEYMLQAYTDSSSDKQVSKTNDQNVYTATAVIETTKSSNGFPTEEKQLKGAALATAPLPASPSATLKYLVDNDTSFTTLFANTTEDSLSQDQSSVNAAGVHLPEYQEIQFRLEMKTTGGLEGPIVPRALEYDSDLRRTKSTS